MYENPLVAQELLLSRSIVVKNKETADYIMMWFDTMLDKLQDITGVNAIDASLGSMIYDIAERTKIKRGLFRYGYKKTIIRFDVDPYLHTVLVDLYLFDDVLKVAPGCYNSVVRLNLNKDISIAGFQRILKKHSYFHATVIVPNREKGMCRYEVTNTVVGELVDFIAIMLFSVMRRKTITSVSQIVMPPKRKNRPRNTTPSDLVTIDETKKTPIYKNINRKRGPVDHQYTVRGHYRHYKSGHVTYVSSYVCCKNKPKKGD